MEVLFCHEASALFLPTKATIPILKFHVTRNTHIFFTLIWIIGMF